MFPQLSSSKSKKAALLSEDDTFANDYWFGAYPPINGCGSPSLYAKLDSEIPVYFESNCIQVTILTTNGVKPQCGVSAVAVDKWSTNNVMLNAWR